ncbi:hypothetical protein [Lactiplantibacillus plantarum]|uniref:hypothetical protein n=1 Tax=Lactiplantibacillus plantarum TaxID=1590 RepID=UPI0021AA0817|nr:hypothetical protein [Lactiplantibacillus plantarum]
MIKFRAWDKNKNKCIIDVEEGYLTNLLCCDGWDLVDPRIFKNLYGGKGNC